MVTLRLPHQHMSEICLLTLALTVLYTSAPVAANYEHYCDSAAFRIQRNGQCGASLASSILTLCRALSETFYGKYIMKRIPSKVGTDKKLHAKLHAITLNKKDAFSYLSKRQGSQNIVCECCVNRCDLTEMYQYCELPPLTYKRAIQAYTDTDHHYSESSSVLQPKRPVTT